VLKTEPAPSTQQARRRVTDRPSTLLLMTLGFQEPVGVRTGNGNAVVLATHEAIPSPPLLLSLLA